jgi:hypothetical protein
MPKTERTEPCWMKYVNSLLLDFSPTSAGGVLVWQGRGGFLGYRHGNGRRKFGRPAGTQRVCDGTPAVETAGYCRAPLRGEGWPVFPGEGAGKIYSFIFKKGLQAGGWRIYWVCVAAQAMGRKPAVLADGQPPPPGGGVL